MAIDLNFRLVDSQEIYVWAAVDCRYFYEDLTDPTIHAHTKVT